MPRPQDIFGRFAQPRALTARADGFTGGREGAATNTTNQGMYTGGWTYGGDLGAGPGGRLTYNGQGYYNQGNTYYTP